MNAIDDLQIYSDLDRLDGSNPAHDDNPDTPMSLMRRAMQQRAYERLCTYRIHVSDAFPFFNFTEFRNPLFLGSFSWSSPAVQEKWITEPHARDIGAGVWVTPGDIARDYLTIKYGGRKRRMNHDQYEVIWKRDVHVPYYCKPGALYDGAVYFDLTGAYWQIVRAVGWDVDYLPGAFLGVSSSMTDFPFRYEKLARNCLVSIGLGRETSFWTGSKIVVRKQKNPLINKVLWRFVCDILNAVAWEARQAGAVYIHTDGYICSGSNSFAVAEVLESWGLQFGVKAHGDYGVVRAIGSYLVGDYQSKPYRESERAIPCDAIYHPGVSWLKKDFLSFVELANRDWLFYKGMEGYDE